MKKIISMLSILAILAVSLLALTGCGDNEKSNSSRKNKNNTENVSNVENNTVSNNTTENTTNNTTGNTTANSNTTTKETPTLDKTAVDINNNDNYYFVINGEKFTIDNKIQEVIDKGYSVTSSNASLLEKEIPSRNYLLSGLYLYPNGQTRLGRVCTVIPVNLTSETLKCTETTIGGFRLDEFSYKDYKGTVSICNGITIGTSMEDVVAILGEPTQKDMREDYPSLGIKYVYKAGSYKSMQFEFDKETNNVTNIEWTNYNFN